MAHLQGAVDPAPPKLLDSLKSYLATWVALIQTRVEIVSTELEEERERLSEIIVFTFTSVFFFSMGILSLTFLTVAIFWEERVAVLTGFTALYLTIGAAAGLFVRHKIKTKPKLFSTTLAELEKDKRHLSS